jgi:tellurite methyltransferase
MATDSAVSLALQHLKLIGAMNRSIEFFDRQFGRQAQAGDYALNPFEQAVLPHLYGEVLDLGCGLGNLSIAAARSGCRVTALDASPAGIDNVAKRARGQGLAIEARAEDLRNFEPRGKYDCVVAIGLLMFFTCPEASRVLARLQDAVRPDGLAAVNVLTAGTTYLEMFDPAGYCLFGTDELAAAFSGWSMVLSRHEEFPAPGATLKRFHTLIAKK